jgi:predicted acyl esterase
MTLYLHLPSETETGLVPEPPTGLDQSAIFSDPENQNPCKGQADSLTWISDPLEEDMLVVGQPEAQVAVSTTTRDFDLFAALDSDESFTPFLATWRARFMLGAENPIPILPLIRYRADLKYAPLAFEFKKSSRIRLTISAAKCRFLENNQTGEDLAFRSEYKAGFVFIHYNAEWPSKLTLPVIDNRHMR